MSKTYHINWDKLAEVNELKIFFNEDYQGFQNLIETKIAQVAAFQDESLHKFARIRVLEVTNGCVQWGFRRGDLEALSVEQTRECMNLVMGFMKRTELYFPSEGLLLFNLAEAEFLHSVRSLYKDAFKNNIKAAEREFYAASAAQFIVCGHQRLQQAMDLVKKDYGTLFSFYYIERGQKYISRFLAGLET